jgi:hypothetical protein
MLWIIHVFQVLMHVESVDWIDLAQDSSKWMAFVNSVINLQIPLKAGDFVIN